MARQLDDLKARIESARDAMNGAPVEVSDYLNPIYAFQTIDSAVAILREEAREASLRALADAREALHAGMGHVAVATFRAEMALAGLSAAKVWYERQEVRS